MSRRDYGGRKCREKNTTQTGYGSLGPRMGYETSFEFARGGKTKYVMKIFKRDTFKLPQGITWGETNCHAFTVPS
jgi:hypothetical protein